MADCHRRGDTPIPIPPFIELHDAAGSACQLTVRRREWRLMITSMYRSQCPASQLIMSDMPPDDLRTVL